MSPDRETRLWYRQPARQWLEALPLGNGTIGAMLWGGPQRERADLNIDTLWSGGPRLAACENSKALLAELRAAVIERHDYVEADALVRGLQGPFNEAYQPLGWLTVDFDGIYWTSQLRKVARPQRRHSHGTLRGRRQPVRARGVCFHA